MTVSSKAAADPQQRPRNPNRSAPFHRKRRAAWSNAERMVAKSSMVIQSVAHQHAFCQRNV
ncbi:hypothetical protein SDC9_131611 [bioreactor metagenome]|uniref:Uncharacterized protein n=1 Tax=bioreactor metagenome TaxID=1076179 RepID=A0A645D640_9ZZZZ